MSIEQQIKIIERVNIFVENLQKQYANNDIASHELKKLNLALQKLQNYLNQLNRLKPNYNTNEITIFVDAVNIHLIILKSELERQDYDHLAKNIKGLKTLLKFHATKWSFLQFIIAWFVELIYFI